jgi:predicted ATP-dependent serine protease
MTGLARGQGYVVVVEGAPGIGKSALLLRARERSTRDGVRMLLGEAFEAQQAVPFAPLLAALATADPPVLGAATAKELQATGDPQY